MTTTPGAIDSFSGRYSFLSNFFRSPLVYEGIYYPTVEHAFQAAKTLIPAERLKVAQESTPRAAKRAGRRLSLRDDWREARLAVMLDLLRIKFAANTPLAAKLLDTGEAQLVEGNTWNDRFWGVVDGVGENHLGRTLMTVRSEIASIACDQTITCPP